MNRSRICLSMLVLIACCLFLVPARTVFADETMTHIEGTVSFGDDNDSRGQRPESVPIVVATRRADRPASWEGDFGDSKTQKICYVSDSTNWKYDADIPTVDEDGNALAPVVSVVYSPDAPDSELPPYAVTKSGYDFRMTYCPQIYDINIAIKWNDAHNADRVRPVSLAGSVGYPNSAGTVGLTTLWKSQDENNSSETVCAFKNQKLYGRRTTYNDRFGATFSTCQTYANWNVSLDFGGTTLVNGSTVTDGNYSYTMTEHIGKDNVPSYEIVAVHQPKSSGGSGTGSGTETDNKPGGIIPDNQKPNEQVKPATDENKTDKKKDDKVSPKPEQKTSALPKTGDSSIASTVIFVAAGAAFAFLGISLKRR